MPKSFVFILNHLECRDATPIEVIPGHFFQKAEPCQVARIREILGLLYPYPLAGFFPYEYDIDVREDTPSSHSWASRPLDSRDWKYWVISFEGSNSEIRHLQYAAALLKNELEFGFTVIGDMPGISSKREDGYTSYGWKLPQVMSYLDQDRLALIPLIRTSTQDLQQIGQNYRAIKKISEDQNRLTRAFKRFEDLKSLPRSSELIVLGLFSIIECLLTHAPKGSETGDSLTHQLKTKIPLVRKRFMRPLEYEMFFSSGAKEETIWTKLYTYRSRVVHGEEVGIKGELEILRSRQDIISCLQETVKLLLLLALEESELLEDLRKC